MFRHRSLWFSCLIYGSSSSFVSGSASDSCLLWCCSSCLFARSLSAFNALLYLCVTEHPSATPVRHVFLLCFLIFLLQLCSNGSARKKVNQSADNIPFYWLFVKSVERKEEYGLYGLRNGIWYVYVVDITTSNKYIDESIDKSFIINHVIFFPTSWKTSSCNIKN